ncbi:DNA replication complex GINS family protein [Candidatus Bathyarchaeota archaeon]|nr:DNA replication complex GINS family protein [Candidatus Bathyarchaeota archaeon]
MPMKIENLDFCFENLLVRVTADRNYPEIQLAGLSAGPFEEGNEYEVYYWIAQELAAAGIVHFREDDLLNATNLYKIQWKERVQIAGQISELTEDFYPKLRRYLADIKAEIAKHPEKAQEYEKAKHLACDIVNSRLKKIVALSSGPAQTGQLQKKFTCEERFIYEQLGKIINEWKAQILYFEGER